MKTTLLITASLGVLLAGCGEKQSDKSASPTNPPAQAPTYAPVNSGNPLDAPGNYLRGIGRAQQTAVKTADVASLNQAIQLFNVQEGRLPKDLNELVTEKYIREIPKPPYGMKIVYDAVSGKVKVVPQ